MTAHEVLGEHPFCLGLFGLSVSGGISMTDAAGAFDLTWPGTRDLARQADAMGLDLLVPVARWRGYDGRLDPNGASYETFTWAAGIAASTSRIVVTATAHAPTLHPLVAAKQAATIDAISGGRFALNAVMGWFAPELAMFGLETAEHADRYRFGDEWMSVIDRLWSDPEPFDHHGTHFTMTGARSRPRPSHRPLVINAGSSPAGVDFAVRHADVNFATMMFMGQLGVHSESFSDQIAAQLEEHFVSSGGGYPVVGSAERVADELASIADAGFDGFMMGGVPYDAMLARFEVEVLPLLRERGLRRS